MKKFLIAVIFCLGLFSGVVANAATYYVSNSGNDSADGMSESTAWRTLEKINQQVFKPGDKILLKAGDIWNSNLWVRGSGSENNMISVGKYGNGAKPLINGNGSNATVFLYNQQYVKISDLEITNRGQEAWRYGVYVYGYNAGALNGIKIENLTIHDVNGCFSDTIEGEDNHWNGGIVVSARGDIATRFVDLTITDCEIYDVARTGIAIFSNYGTSYDKKVVGMTQNMRISNNVVHNTKGDGIIVCGDYYGQVTGNTVYETNLMSYEDGMKTVNVGIFAIHSTGTVIAENESYLSRTTYDGFGYDIDGDCDNVKVQYNYSHDNEGGFLLLVNHNNHGAVARYNISQNDKNQSIAVAAPTNNGDFLNMTAEIYNNTIYGAPDGDFKMLNLSTSFESLKICNNIFYLIEPKGMFDDVYNNISSTNGLTLSNNIYYGNNSVSTLSKYDSYAICKDPLLVNAGSGGNGRNTLGGYKLQENSPCVGNGVVIENNGGYDFWGNRIPAGQNPSIGAHQR